MDWFENQFVILGGIPFQNWMALALAMLAVGLVVAWWIGRIEW
jgi:hypothetical protein